MTGFLRVVHGATPLYNSIGRDGKVEQDSGDVTREPGLQFKDPTRPSAECDAGKTLEKAKTGTPDSWYLTIIRCYQQHLFLIK